MGLFDKEKIDFEIGSRIENEKFKDMTKTPAFFYDYDEAASTSHPHSLEEVLDCILLFLDNYSWNNNHIANDVFDQMITELKERKVEIKANYLAVFWSGGEYSWGSELFSGLDLLNDDLKYKDVEFKYDPEKITRIQVNWDFQYDPENGESFNIEYIEPEFP